MIPVLEMSKVGVTYSSGSLWDKRSFAAVKNMNLKVWSGETVGLIGESGSGKSTTGRLCLGLQNPTVGEVRFRGIPFGRGERPRLAAVLQHPRTSLNPRLKVGTSVAEPLVIQRVSSHAQAERVAASLQKVGLRPDLAERYPHELSGGQRQRAAIARALIGQPEFILFDEPVSALDASVQAQILNLILDLQSELGFATLFISHDFAATRYVAERIIVMKDGEVIDEAFSNDLFEAAAHPYTRSLQEASGLLDG